MPSQIPTTTRLAFGLAAVLVVAIIAATATDFLAGRPLAGPLVTCTLGGLACLASLAGLAGLSWQSAPMPGTPQPPWTHVLQLVGVGFLSISAAASVRTLLVPETYGQHGPWRGQSAVEQRTIRPPRHQQRAACHECHAAQAARHGKDLHGRVECETCHGPGLDHVAAVRAMPAATATASATSPAASHPAKKLYLEIPATQGPCLWCHRRLVARPTTFPQIDRAEHFALVGVKDPDTPCMKCHDPHEPLFLDRSLDQARLHPIIHQCRNCHLKAVDPTAAKPSGHPVVFECAYCHRDLARDFAKKPHGRIGCNRCHIFHRESDEAGRIVKNRDPRFCLLCHKAGDFRGGEGAPPLIRWPDHLSDMGVEPDPKQSCLDCHMKDAIHDVASGPKDGATDPGEPPSASEQPSTPSTASGSERPKAVPPR